MKYESSLTLTSDRKHEDCLLHDDKIVMTICTREKDCKRGMVIIPKLWLLALSLQLATVLETEFKVAWK